MSHSYKTVPLGEVRAWLQRHPGVPTDRVEPFAGLLAHYGLRLPETDAERSLRKALIAFLDKQDACREDFDPIADHAELLLDCIERQRGGNWPLLGGNQPLTIMARPSARTDERAVEAVIGRYLTASKTRPEAPEDVVEAAKSLILTIHRSRPLESPMNHGMTITVQRGIGSDKKQGLTDKQMLLCIAAHILAEPRSREDALDSAISIFKKLGLRHIQLNSATAEVSLANKRVLIALNNLIADHPVQENGIPSERVRAAYQEVSAHLSDEYQIHVPCWPGS